VKGLELDGTVVVDPDAILAEEAQGLRALYVALTRATKLLSVVHGGELPEVLANPITQARPPSIRALGRRRLSRPASPQRSPQTSSRTVLTTAKAAVPQW
jgi:hypothetical protein